MRVKKRKINDAILKKGRFSNSIFKKQNETPLWQTLAYQNIIHGLPWWFRGSDCAPSPGGVGSIPGQGAKTPHATCVLCPASQACLTL